MRSFRHRALIGAIILPLALITIFILYVFKRANSDPTTSSLRFQSGQNISSFRTHHSSKVAKAAILSPTDLMARPPSPSQLQVPKLLHQSWSTTTLPAKFEQWSVSCREMNPDFEWVLWTDEDNRKLVEKYVPDFLPMYDELKSEIYRADAVRNLYMFVFGGVYFDLDTECLRPYEALFAQHNTSFRFNTETISTHTLPLSIVPTSISTSLITSHTSTPRTALLARMGTDYSKKFSIPNAWMASTSLHHFWLLPLNLVATGSKPYGDWPEAVTGPDALFHLVNEYLREYAGEDGAEARLYEFLRTSKMKDLYVRSLSEKDLRPSAGLPRHQLLLLEREMIFPYWWGAKELEGVCKAGVEGFDPETCKDVLDVEELKSLVHYILESLVESGGGPRQRTIERDGELDLVFRERKPRVAVFRKTERRRWSIV